MVELTFSDDFLDILAERLAPRLALHQARAPSAWLTLEQAAEYLGRTPGAVRGLVKRGDLPSYKRGGRLQFSREGLDAWVRGE